MKIVIVEDDSFCAQLVASLVRRQNAGGMELEVQSYSSSKDFANSLNSEDFDVVIVDYHMPEIDGLELASRILSHPRHEAAAILMVTADASRDLKHRALEIGILDFLPKPIDPLELRARLSNMIRIRTLQKRMLRESQDRRFDINDMGVALS